MKKLALLMAANLILAGAAVAAPQDSTIPLPIDGDGVVKAQSVLGVSLKPLIPGVIYDVSCQIDDHTGTNVMMRFDLQSNTGYTFYGFTLNGKKLQTQQGQLVDQKTDNLAAVRASLLSTGGPTDALFNFTNLDNTVSVRVHDCSAVPAIGQK